MATEEKVKPEHEESSNMFAKLFDNLSGDMHTVKRLVKKAYDLVLTREWNEQVRQEVLRTLNEAIKTRTKMKGV